MTKFEGAEKEEGITSQEGGTEFSSVGTRSMRGLNRHDNRMQKDSPNPAQKGSNFENLARQEVFQGEAKRLVVRQEDNQHLDKFGDGIGLTKNRRITDAYINEDGSIWELKSGYETGVIDREQLEEYSLMERAGYVNIRDGESVVKTPVNSINYLFETKTGAEANAAYLYGEATPWYLDENKKVHLLEHGVNSYRIEDAGRK